MRPGISETWATSLRTGKVPPCSKPTPPICKTGVVEHNRIQDTGQQSSVGANPLSWSSVVLNRSSSSQRRAPLPSSSREPQASYPPTPTPRLSLSSHNVKSNKFSPPPQPWPRLPSSRTTWASQHPLEQPQPSQSGLFNLDQVRCHFLNSRNDSGPLLQSSPD